MKKKIYCIPYAGGSTLFYSQLGTYLEGWELVPLELSGRGLRMDEPLYSDFKEALRDLLARFLSNHQTGDPCIILGYSMGALLAYELTCELEEKGIFPLNLICAASDPPSTHRELASIYTLNDDQLIDYYTNAGGIETLTEDEKELLKCFLPIIRGDLQVLETYSPSRIKLRTPLLIYSGNADSLKELRQWADYSFQVREELFEGNHYFLRDNYREVAQRINQLC